MEKVMEKSKPISLKNVLKAIGLIVLFFVCNKASVNLGYLTPFCFGLYYAIMFNFKNVWLISGCFYIGYTLSAFNLNSVYIALNIVVVALVFSNIHNYIKRKAHYLLVCLYSILGNIIYICLNAVDNKSLVLSIISLILGELFLVCCMHFFKLSKRNIKTKLTTDEVMCLGVIVSVISMGLANLTFFKIEMLKIVGACLVLVLSYTAENKTTIVLSALYGIGASVFYTNISYVASFVVYSLCAIGFKSSYKVISAVAIMLAEVVIGLYFLGYASFNVFSLLSVIIGEILFLLIPTKWLNYTHDKIMGLTENVAVRSIINRSRDTLTRRMTEVSNVFLEMDTVYKQMVQGSLPETEAKQMIKTELYTKCCKNCENRNKCTRVNGQLNLEMFDDMVNAGFEKGKLNLLDVPQYLTSTCGRVNYMLTTLNALLGSYKHYNVMVTNMDASKILLADQLKGVSILLKTLAEEVNLNIVYDVAKETRLKEELGYNNLCCLEALVYEQSATLKFVSLILAEPEIDKHKLEKIVSKITKNKMQVVSVTDALVTGAKEVVLKTKANYDIVFGSASQTKTGKVVSGDTHSLIKIDDGKYMVALCDGMGSGEKAHKVSDLTLTLIENFYKAGFENDIILNSVNKLLTLNSEEKFSALDICVIDLYKSLIDFIKLGSPTTFVKHKFETEVVETSGLPMGILDEMKPHITKKVFTNFDMIVLVSDGVFDAMGEKALQEYINNVSTTNPQSLADQVLDKAVENCNGTLTDDFTVVCVRVYEVV